MGNEPEHTMRILRGQQRQKGFPDKFRWGRKLPTSSVEDTTVSHQRVPQQRKFAFHCSWARWRDLLSLCRMWIWTSIPFFSHPRFLFDMFSLLQEIHSTKKMHMVKSFQSNCFRNSFFMMDQDFIFFSFCLIRFLNLYFLNYNFFGIST